MTTSSLTDRFWAKVDRTGECWIWIGGRNDKGYGRFSINGRLVYPHRLSYEHANGAIPFDKVIDHLCRNPACVRPDHLEAVTRSQNVARGSQGFELTGLCRAGLHDVTIPGNVVPTPRGGRQCLPCKRGYRATYWQEKHR